MCQKISIITPSYNSGKTLEKTLLSVIEQSPPIPIEYIIIDGGSTDNTLEIINQYRKYIHVFISEPDLGAYDAMNKGISYASGDIIGIINSDDWYHQNTLKLVIAEFTQNPSIDILYSPIDNYYQGEYVATFKPGELDKLAIRFTLNHPSCFIKKNAYKKTGVYNLKYSLAADYEMIMRLYYNGYKFHYLDTPLAAYSLNGMSSSNNPIHRGKLIYECWRISKKADIYLEENIDKQRFTAYLLWIFNELFALPVRYFLKPTKARKLKMFLRKYLQSPVSEEYGQW